MHTSAGVVIFDIILILKLLALNNKTLINLHLKINAQHTLKFNTFGKYMQSSYKIQILLTHDFVSSKLYKNHKFINISLLQVILFKFLHIKFYPCVYPRLLALISKLAI